MTVEVIGYDESAYFKAVCPDCGSVLRYLRVDIKEETRTDYTGDTDTYKYIECPRCKRRLTRGLARPWKGEART